MKENLHTINMVVISKQKGGSTVLCDELSIELQGEIRRKLSGQQKKDWCISAVEYWIKWWMHCALAFYTMDDTDKVIDHYTVEYQIQNKF